MALRTEGTDRLKPSVKVATTANIADLAAGAPDPVDGVSLSVDDRVLVLAQSTGAENGIYKVDVVGTGADGTWSRVADYDQDAEVRSGDLVFVQQGTQSGLYHLSTVDPIQVGVTSLSFLPVGEIQGSGTANHLAYFSASDTITSEASGELYWDSSNNLLGVGLIPPTSPAYALGVTDNIGIWRANGTPATSPQISFERSRGTLSVPTTNVAGDVLGRVRFLGYTDQRSESAAIEGVAATGWGTGGDSPGAIAFLTQPDGGGGLAERMRLDSAGNVIIASTPTTASALLDVDGSAIFNKSGASVDFIVEGNGTPAAIHVTGANGRVGINNATPAKRLHVTGEAQVDGNFTVGGGGRVIVGDATEPTPAASTTEVYQKSDDLLYAKSTDLGYEYLLTTAVSETLAYAASVGLDFDPGLPPVKTVTLAGDITFTTSNLASGRGLQLRIVGDGSNRTLTFPAGWKFLGGPAPTSLPASNTAILSLSAFGAADADVIAGFSFDTTETALRGSGTANHVAYFSDPDSLTSDAGLTWDGSDLVVAGAAATSGTQPLLTATGAAHTGLTASTENVDIDIDLARTVQFATGALATQRAMIIQAPTYAFAGASTLTDAVTLAITGAPAAGTNATITNSYGLSVEGGAVFNDSGAAVDFRVEGDTTPNLFFLDASADRIVINNTSGAGRFSNTGSAVVDEGAVGQNTDSYVWRINQVGYAGAWANDSTSATANGMLIRVAGTTTQRALTINSAGTDRFYVDGSGALTQTAGGGTWEGAHVFNEAGGSVDFRVEGSGAGTNPNLFFVDASDNRVGIGTATPNVKFEVSHGSAGTIGSFLNTGGSGPNSGGAVRLAQNDGTVMAADERLGQFGFSGFNGVNTLAGAEVEAFAAGTWNNTGDLRPAYLTFSTAGASGGAAERMRIASNGFVGIGTDSSIRNLQVTSDAVTTMGLSAYNSTVGQRPAFSFVRAGGSASSPAAVANNWVLGEINFNGYRDASTERTGGQIIGRADGTWTGSNEGTDIEFWNTPNGGTALTEALRLDSNGNLRILQDRNLSIGASNDLTLQHDGTNSIIANATGDLQINGVAASEVVFNESGIDVDFRVEGAGGGTTLTHALFVQASNGNVGINRSNPGVKLVVEGATGESTIVGIIANAAAGDVQMLDLSSFAGSSSTGGAGIQAAVDDGAAMASGDRLGYLRFSGARDASSTISNTAWIEAFASSAWSGTNSETHMVFRTTALNATAGVERMRISGAGAVQIPTDSVNLSIGAGDDLTLQHDGTNSIIANATGDLQINGVAASEVVFNESGIDVDFRVEGDTRPNLLFVDAGNDQVGINRTAGNTGATLDVDNLAVAESIFIARDNGTAVFTIADGGAITAAGNIDAQNGLDVTTAALTTAAGITNSGGEVLVSGGNVQLNDSIALTLGTGDDLSLSHDGTDSLITNATGDLRVTPNGNLDVRGGLLARRVVEAITATETVSADTDNRRIYTDVGAGAQITVNLPAAAVGLEVEFAVVDGQGFTVDAAGTDTIQVAGSVSSAGGTASATTTGNTLRLTCVASGKWFATASHGTWTLA